jgi:putative peptidoglycan lipid II flippase
MYLPIGLFGVSVATAVLPAVSRHAVDKNDAGVRDTVTSGLSLMLMLNVPATIGLVVLAEPIVRLIFERQRFMPADTIATAAALQCYAIGLLGYSIVRITSPTFYALGLNRTPVIVSVASVLVNAGLNWWLVGVWGYRGLAVGTSVAALFNAAALLFFLHRRLDGLNDARVLGSFLRITIASIVMGAAAYFANRELGSLIGGTGLAAQLMRVFGSIAVALAVLTAAAWALRIEEFNRGVALITRRFRAGR